MTKTVVGLFDDFNTAEQVVRDLQKSGFSRDDISLMSPDRQQAGRETTRTEGTHAGEGAVAGAGTGAVLGGLGGLLVGLGALAIPGVGPIIAAGPLAAALAGAGVGAAAGGFVGALVGAGVPEEEANAYAEGVRRGGTLVMVRSSNSMAGQASDIMNRHGAIDIKSRVQKWRQTNNWTRFDEAAGPFSDTGRTDYRTTGTPQSTGGYGGATGVGMERSSSFEGMRRDFNAYRSDFRDDYNSLYGGRGRDYNYYEPAYRYGYDLAGNERYRGRSWNEIEPDVRRDWERTHPDNPFAEVRDAIRHAWERVTS